MVNLSSYTYQHLRQWFQNTYTWVALYDNNSNEVTRIDIENDSRASWSSSPSSNPLVATINLTGSDSDITPPVTLSGSESFESETATEGAGLDGFADATIKVDADELTLTHEIHLPQ